MQSRQGETTRFVVGLGNPSRQYARTRHNVGFRVLQELRRRWQLGEGRKAFSGRMNDARLAGPAGAAQRVILLEPHTYMNRSGQAVREMVTFYKACPADVLMVLDDMALPSGRLRMRLGGSSGGHNGLSDVLSALGSEEVPRLRVGIGQPPPMADAADYVLSPFAPEETGVIEQAVVRAAQAVEDWVFHGHSYVMDKYNPKE
jgi:PTH1 family peptidyl-tRNA hydrolase